MAALSRLASGPYLGVRLGPAFFRTLLARRGIRVRPARRRLIALCAAALACARPEAPSEPTVALRYGWPAGLAAEVDVHSTRIQLIGGTHKRGEVRSSYRLATAAEGSGLRVQFLDAKFWFDPG